MFLIPLLAKDFCQGGGYIGQKEETVWCAGENWIRREGFSQLQGVHAVCSTTSPKLPVRWFRQVTFCYFSLLFFSFCLQEDSVGWVFEHHGGWKEDCEMAASHVHPTSHPSSAGFVCHLLHNQRTSSCEEAPISHVSLRVCHIISLQLKDLSLIPFS